MSPRTTYDDALRDFGTLIEAARPILLEAAERGLGEAPHLLAFGRECLDLGRSAEGPLRRVASLRQLRADYLTYWNEASGPHVDAFWEAVRAAGLDLQRRDILGEILRRGRITSVEAYEVAVDQIVVARQEGRLTEAQAADLARWIGDYEARHG